MHSPALALSWQLGRRRLRWLLPVLLLVIAAAACTVWLSPKSENTRLIVLFCTILAPCVIAGLAGVTSFGCKETVGEKSTFRESSDWMLTLPVRTEALVGWSMFYGAMTVTLAWLGWDWLVLRPYGLVAPALWPPLLCIALNARMQAGIFIKARYFLEPLISIVSLGFIAIGYWILLVRLFHQMGPSYRLVWAPDVLPEPVLAVLFMALIPPAFVAGVERLSRYRSGDRTREVFSSMLEALREVFNPQSQVASQLPPSFSSPGRAQVWFEFQTAAGAFSCLPCMLATIWFLCPLGLAFLGEVKNPEIGIVSLPAFGCFFSAFVSPMCGASPHSRFTATLPMPTGSLFFARIKTIAIGVLAGSAVTVLETCVLLCFPLYRSGLADWISQSFPESYRPPEAAYLALVCVGFLVFSWHQSVAAQFSGLTGRGWIMACGILAQMGIGCAFLAGVVQFHIVRDFRTWLVEHASWLMPLAVLALILKFATAARAIQAIHRRRLLATGTLLRLLGLWFLAFAGLTALVTVLLPSGLMSLPAIACGVALALPLARVSLAPLTLAWNRHR